MLQTEFKDQSAQDNPVFTTYKNKTSQPSPLIVTWPHNGLWVPEDLYIGQNPMGWPPSAFDPKNLAERRHEVVDWGMQELLEDLINQTTNTHIVSEVSRLVVDHNRIAKHAITEHSDDTDEAIPANLSLSSEQIDERIRNYHTPYHEEIDRAIQIAKDQHGFAAVLDMHSFTRTFKGRERDVCIGTIKPRPTHLSDLVERELAERSSALGLTYSPDAPYNIRVDQNDGCVFTNRNAGQDIAERNGVEYVGVEICNDALACSQKRLEIALMMRDLITEITPKLQPSMGKDLDNYQLS